MKIVLIVIGALVLAGMIFLGIKAFLRYFWGVREGYKQLEEDWQYATTVIEARTIMAEQKESEAKKAQAKLKTKTEETETED